MFTSNILSEVEAFEKVVAALERNETSAPEEDPQQNVSATMVKDVQERNDEKLPENIEEEKQPGNKIEEAGSFSGEPKTKLQPKGTSEWSEIPETTTAPVVQETNLSEQENPSSLIDEADDQTEAPVRSIGYASAAVPEPVQHDLEAAVDGLQSVGADPAALDVGAVGVQEGNKMPKTHEVEVETEAVSTIEEEKAVNPGMDIDKTRESPSDDADVFPNPSERESVLEVMDDVLKSSTQMSTGELAGEPLKASEQESTVVVADEVKAAEHESTIEVADDACVVSEQVTEVVHVPQEDEQDANVDAIEVPLTVVEPNTILEPEQPTETCNTDAGLDTINLKESNAQSEDANVENLESASRGEEEKEGGGEKVTETVRESPEKPSETVEIESAEQPSETIEIANDVSAVVGESSTLVEQQADPCESKENVPNGKVDPVENVPNGKVDPVENVPNGKVDPVDDGIYMETNAFKLWVKCTPELAVHGDLSEDKVMEVRKLWLALTEEERYSWEFKAESTEAIKNPEKHQKKSTKRSLRDSVNDGQSAGPLSPEKPKPKRQKKADKVDSKKSPSKNKKKVTRRSRSNSRKGTKRSTSRQRSSSRSKKKSSKKKSSKKKTSSTKRKAAVARKKASPKRKPARRARSRSVSKSKSGKGAKRSTSRRRSSSKRSSSRRRSSSKRSSSGARSKSRSTKRTVKKKVSPNKTKKSSSKKAVKRTKAATAKK